VNLQPLFDLAIPVASFALSLALTVLLGLLVAQRSLRKTEFCPQNFPLARKLFPASVALITTLAARAMFAALKPKDFPFFALVLSITAIWCTAYLMVRMLWVLVHFFNHRFDLARDNNVRSRRVLTQLQFIEKFAYVLVLFLAVCATLLLFEGARSFGESLLASAGVAGLVIGFAAQKSLGNLIAGFQIAFTQPLRIEDAVLVEGEWGWVEEITLTYVVIRIWDQRRLILPITYFVENPFQNWTRTTAQILGAITLEVAHCVPFQAIEAELYRVLEETPLWDRDKRVLQMVEVGERAVTLRALMTARDSPTCWDLRCHVRLKLVEFLQREHPQALPALRVHCDSDLRHAPLYTIAPSAVGGRS
jgi:small-conductance mechanosensitive channel